MDVKQWRVVFDFKKDLLRGSGCVFVIAFDEASVRGQVEQSMPGARILDLKEEPEDPRSVYQRPPLTTMECLRSSKPAPNGDCWCAICSAVRLVTGVVEPQRGAA